ncbi:MAG TPA: carbohydrate kinase family protein [Anaerolineae bacterium]|nr:carbohydrate kinase family protein [Anaerolineae bacterium]
MKIVITGSIAFDYLMSFPGKINEQFLDGQMQNISLSFLVDSMKRQRGGVAPNIAYTLGLLGGAPTVMGMAGQDFTSYGEWLNQHGIDTSAVVIRQDDYCASFFCTTDTTQNQIASFYPGAMAYAGELSLADHAADADLVIVSPNDPAAMERMPNECRDMGIDFIFDPSQQTIRMNGDQLINGIEGSRLLTSNEYERSLILDKTGLSEDEILAKTGGWLVTLGAEGSLLRVDGEEYHIPIVPPEQIVEPTGAGDAFRAGLMRGIQLGLPWEICGRMGALSSVYVLENFGPQGHHFTKQAFIDRYRQHFDDEGALDQL